MTKHGVTIALVGAVSALILLHAAPAQAEQSVNWVASYGSDQNFCNRQAPCQSFQAAHNAAASGGVIYCVDAGDYSGLTITKSISIVCDNTQALISPLIATSAAVTINAGASDTITLIGLDIDTLGIGFGAVAGIIFNSGAALHLSKVKIRNVFKSSGDAGGIYFQPNAYAELYITDSIITGNGGTGSISGGIIITPSGSGSVNASINGVRVENNSTGIIVDGTRGSTIVNATIVNTVVAGNQHDGVIAKSGPGSAFAFFDHSVASGNFGSGVTAVGGAATARIGDSTINLNVNGVSSANGGTVQSYKNNRISGNLTDGTPLPAVALQ